MNQYANIFVQNEEEKGSTEGYAILSQAEQLINWISDKGYSKKIASEIRSNYKKISILKFMHVEEEE